MFVFSCWHVGGLFCCLISVHRMPWLGMIIKYNKTQQCQKSVVLRPPPPMKRIFVDWAEHLSTFLLRCCISRALISTANEYHIQVNGIANSRMDAVNAKNSAVGVHLILSEACSSQWLGTSTPHPKKLTSKEKNESMQNPVVSNAAMACCRHKSQRKPV